MHTQYQKSLSMVLLTSLLLQSCNGLNAGLVNPQLKAPADSEVAHEAAPTRQLHEASRPQISNAFLADRSNQHATDAPKALPETKRSAANVKPHQHTSPPQRMTTSTKPRTSATFTTSRGQRVTFQRTEDGQEQAMVQDMTGKQVLPVTFAPGYDVERLRSLEKGYQKQRIHVLDSGVYVGEQGLRGGMMRRDDSRAPSATDYNTEAESDREELKRLQEELEGKEKSMSEQIEQLQKRLQMLEDEAYAQRLQDEEPLRYDERRIPLDREFPFRERQAEEEQKKKQEQEQQEKEQREAEQKRLQEQRLELQRLQSFKRNIERLYNGYANGNTTVQEEVFINTLPGIHRLTSSLCPGSRVGSVDQFIWEVLPSIQEGIRLQHKREDSDPRPERLRRALQNLTVDRRGGLMGGSRSCKPSEIFTHLYAIIAHYQGSSLEGILSRIQERLAEEGRRTEGFDQRGLFPTDAAPSDWTYVSYILLVMYCAAAEFLVENPHP